MKARPFVVATVAVSAILLFGCRTEADYVKSEQLPEQDAQEVEDSMSIPEQIHAANGRFIEAVRAADATAMPALYTKDAQILPPNGELVSGEEAITAFWQSFVELGIRDARPVTLEVIPMGALALEVGTYSLHDEDGTLLDRGKIMVLWKQEGGVWKMHRDMWNSSLSVTGAQS